jgi:hypothetical protein
MQKGSNPPPTGLRPPPPPKPPAVRYIHHNNPWAPDRMNTFDPDQVLYKVLSRLQAIDTKLDQLIEALAGEDEDKPTYTLDGERLPQDRAENQEL